MVLNRDPICVACDYAPSIIADHVIPLSQGGSWALENGQGMCAPCHGAKSRLERRDMEHNAPPGTV